MLCRAKINLTLHVGAKIPSGRWSGYHPVESLVVFADMGDELCFQPAAATRLMIEGAFAAGLSASADNLILKAMRACQAEAQDIRLTKNLPVASGMGGGSANAAAVLRKFDPDMKVDAVSLGADVPVCRLSQTAMMQGIGERVDAIPGLGRVAALLVNPGVGVSTQAIFKQYDAVQRPAHPPSTSRTGSLLQRARAGQNDLQTIAISEAPVIADVLHAIQDREGCQLARMSGSGATCFGLFETMDAAQHAAMALDDRGWWVKPCWLGDQS